MRIYGVASPLKGMSKGKKARIQDRIERQPWEGLDDDLMSAFWTIAAYEEGQLAAKDGFAASANPYASVSSKHYCPQMSRFWQVGYYEQKLNRTPCPPCDP